MLPYLAVRFCMVLGVRFAWISVQETGSSFCRFRVLAFLRSFFLFLLLLFLFWGPARVSLLFFLPLACRTPDIRILYRPELHARDVFSFCFLSLPGSAAFPLSSPASAPLSLSLLFLSLSCVQEFETTENGWVTSGKCSVMSSEYCYC